MKLLSILVAGAMLAGCDAQSALNDAKTICRDGVEYLVYSKMNTSGQMSYSIVPHYKNAQGELFTCGGKPTETMSS